MSPNTLECVASLCFGLAVVHTFIARTFEDLAHRWPDKSLPHRLFHLLGEVEAVFGLWAFVFLVFYTFHSGFFQYDEAHHLVGGVIHYLESLNFTEPAFVFVIMSMAATRPIITFAERLMGAVAQWLPLPEKMALYIAALILGPLLGSFITEPAAMTVTAMILLKNYYKADMDRRFKYATLGLLFVNISVGGTLTHFAAPPVLMVASKWDWGMAHMASNFGYKAALAVVVATLAVAYLFRRQLEGPLKTRHRGPAVVPLWITLVHLLFMGLVVYGAHHPVFFLALFLFFLGFHYMTEFHQDSVKLRESLLVGFFLAGLVTLGTLQAWWIRPVLAGLGDVALYLGTMGLTAITDNAALTYLGSLAPLSDASKYNLVSGAVTGGGLTVIANAPNPAGHGILKRSFGPRGISPLGLLVSALGPTALCILAFQLL